MVTLSFKVAPYNNFLATSSIFESLILKQIDLYGKTIKTHVLHMDKLHYDIIFWEIGITITW